MTKREIDIHILPFDGDVNLLPVGAINIQIDQAIKEQKPVLGRVYHDIYLLSIPKSLQVAPLAIKKWSDRAQYVILPELTDEKVLNRLSFAQLKNNIYQNNIHMPIKSNSVILYFFAVQDSFINKLIELLHSDKLDVAVKKNRLNIVLNNQIILYDINKIISLFLVKNQPFHEFIEGLKAEAIKLSSVMEELSCDLESSQIKLGDLQALSEEMIFLQQEVGVQSLLKSFTKDDLCLKNCYPTINVRSPIYLKARKDVLYRDEEGYIVCAGVIAENKMRPVCLTKRDDDLMSLWLKRSAFYLHHHSYVARAIVDDVKDPQIVSLVGDHVSTVAYFPQLIKGAMEFLGFSSSITKVRLLSHNQDILTIATSDRPWKDINENGERAKELFYLIAKDGADSLSLFEQILLPEFGVGNYNFTVVHESFFDLIHTARDLKEVLPKGHDCYLLGLAFLVLREDGLALEQLQKAYQLDQKDPDILHALGSTLIDTGYVKEALPFLKRAFSLSKEDPEVANNFGKTNLALGNIKEAIHAFEKAVHLNPSSPDYLLNLGQSLWAAKRTDEALKVLHQGIKANPEFAPLYSCMAHIYVDLGEKEKAKEKALLAYQANPTDADIADLLWGLYQKD